ncbi:molybdate-anion transporter [Lepeophtheirus salmonis]|uniref:molybdate-anion transporter n=1 Tax=Lepeophtheirus salmonis TaxID=72036 RepID=UPI001AE0FD14|nr:molybdate-anion transporter-like [Lepeophtheirus salmonis]
MVEEHVLRGQLCAVFIQENMAVFWPADFWQSSSPDVNLMGFAVGCVLEECPESRVYKCNFSPISIIFSKNKNCNGALISDWLQGPYVYNLYEYYGYQEFQIAVLYTTGFASSVLFGTFTGPIADAWGRKFMAIMYCIFYTICCLTKLSSNFSMLMLGRVFGGIATSILFSTFEAWYVYEHQNNENKFPKEWISSTFSVTTFFNGLLAILAGVIANFVAETMGFGPVSPFLVALVPLILCFFIVKLTWPENYGSQVSTSLGTSCMDGFKQIFADKSILRLGIVQSSVESILYIFVFLWTPVLSPLKPPLGIIFADFMICIMIGSKIHRVLLDRYSWKEKEVLQSVCLILITSLSVVFSP